MTSSGTGGAVDSFRYRAYLSYSHKDERWARWVHRSLEAYRIPGHLRSATDRPLPDRLSPIFRDRDDLSTASNLSERLEEALADSECLIVVCSPEAAASRWVNEEIRRFRALGRGREILCVVVDGDPAASVDEGSCFPPALTEGVEEGGREPLAADPRDYADGKRLALLKLVAGILDVKLDDLRRRDLRRRRRLQALSAVLVIAAGALAALTVTSKIAERQERAQAEQLAAFIVDLGDDLRQQLDLEALGRISGKAMEYHDQLNPARLESATGIRVAQALLLFGEVNLLQGEYEKSEDAYRRAVDILERLADREPDNAEVAFELAQAEFYFGFFLSETGHYDEALVHFSAYLDIATRFYAAAPDDPVWILERAYANSALVNFQIERGDPIDQALLDALQHNLELASEAMDARPGDAEALDHYANELAFLADAQAGSCRLNAALSTREGSLFIAQRRAEEDPFDRELAELLAFQHSGLANVLAALGNLERAEEHQEHALDALEPLVERDPSNEQLATLLASNYRRLGKLHAYAEQAGTAAASLAKARSMLAPIVADQSGRDWQTEEYIRLVLDEVDLALMLGDRDQARALLRKHGPLIVDQGKEEMPDSFTMEARIEYRYANWRLDGIDPASSDARLAMALPDTAGPFRSCYDSFWLAAHAVMIADRGRALEEVQYLQDVGFRDPAYLAFCRRESLCDE